MMDVRYYLIDKHGRSQLRAATDADALDEAARLRDTYPTLQKRVIKETRETIWENEE